MKSMLNQAKKKLRVSSFEEVLTFSELEIPDNLKILKLGKSKKVEEISYKCQKKKIDNGVAHTLE